MVFKPMRIEAVLFDFDGTLTKPDALDFSVIKREIGCPPDQTILEFIETLAAPEQRAEALSTVDRMEIQAAENSEPNTGSQEVLAYLRENGIPVGIISRNSFHSIKRALENFEKIDVSDFDIIISRDAPLKPKPSADGVKWAAQKLNVDASHILIVGDYIFDMMAGREAGAVTVFLDRESKPKTGGVESDYEISSLEELKKIVRMGRPLPMGKLPNDLLEEFLDQFAFDDPSVLIFPGVGEDTAAVDVADEEVLVLKSDPITFATDSIGHYAVLINANDIATSGATPRWFLTTLFFPSGTTPSEIYHVMHELKTVCQSWNITLCGGHTEITDAVTRPVITGMLAGTVARNELIDKRNMRPGDKVLLSKGVAVEGTAIIATEFANRLRDLGMSDAELEECRQFISRISILKEAQIARCFAGVSAMHDITEGGLATAVNELGISGGCRIRINMDKIPIFHQTERICRLLGIDPIGLIGSGSLLICCRESTCESLMSGISETGIGIACIGEILEEGRGVEAIKNGVPVAWPNFEVDEITRLFS